MRKLCCLLLLFALSAPAFSENFGRRFDEGYELLEAGNADSALQNFLDLKTDTPDSLLVDYSIASALYGQGMQAMVSEEWETAVEKFTEAREGFDKLGDSQERFLQENVPFGSANCTTQLAKLLDPGSEYKERIEALQNAIQNYESIVEQFPKNKSAKTNLNHTRFMLKSMLQNPPPDQRRADDGEGEGDEGENQQQNQEEGEQDQEGEQQDGEQSDADQQSESDPSQGESDQTSDSQQNQSQSQPLEDENIEAILQSLEDQNSEEQKNLRRARGAPQVKDGKWW